MAKIVTLKKNNEVIYPVTKAEAVIGGGAGYDASWLAATPPVVATAEQADALCQAISDGVPIYLRYEDVPQGDPYITYATDASTTGGEPVVTFLTGALNGTKTARTYTISRGGMGVQGSVYSSTTTLVDTQSGKVTASNIDFTTFTSLNMPIAHTTATMMYGTTMNLTRQGNIVQGALGGRFNAAGTQAATSTEKIPVGYRPKYSVRGAAFIGGKSSTCQLNTNGTFFYWTTAAPAQDDEINWGGCWITEDAFPR